MAETKPTANQKLRYERERRGWSQQEVADKVGTTPLNVGRWERGITMPGPHFRVKLSEVFEKSPAALGLVSDSPAVARSLETPLTPGKTTVAADTPASLWNVPYNRNHFFTGREDILLHLRDAFLNDEQPIAISQAQAISGLGGIGKTQTAIEYAYRYRESYMVVLWARADSADLLTSDFLTISVLLNLPQRNEQEQSVVVKAVLHWFDTHEGWLLILDNADHLEEINEFLPSAGKGHVLLTTRAHSTGTIAQRLELEKMGLEEGMLFLLRRMKRLKGTAGLESAPETVRNQARAIVEAIDGLPLALDQAGAYIEETGCSLNDYLKFYKTRRNRLLRIRGRSATGHPEPVATTWSLSFEKVEHANPAAAELLRLCAFLHPDEIPEAMIIEGSSKLGPILQAVAEDELDWNEVIGELHKYSLIKRDPEEKILAVHRLVQAVIRDGMTEQERKQWTERTIAALDAVFPDITRDGWGQSERLLPHVLIYAAPSALEKYNLELASLLRRTADYLRERAQYERAEPLYLRALHIWEQTLGPEHSDVAYSLNGLAMLYTEQGKYEQAEPLYQRAIKIREQALGLEHPQVAWPLNNLANLYYEQGKYEQAELLHLRALHTREQALGFDHPYVAYSLNNLANLYLEQDKYEQAEPLYWRAIKIREQALGLEHPQVAWPLNGLANLYLEQGKYEQAEPLYLRALTIREQALGFEHPQVAYPLNGLAILYLKQGKYEQAEALFQRALQINEQGLGAEHPEVATSLNGLANLYTEQGAYERAEPLFQRALTIRQYGRPEHPDTAENLHDFAHFFEVRKQPGEALELYLQALAIREKQFGPQHPHTAETRARAAQLLRESGRTEEADELENFPEQEAMTSDQPAK